MEQLTVQERNKTAALYGIITGVFYIMIATIYFSQVSNMVAASAVKIAGYVLFLAITALLAARIRKANGGYIEFKEIYGAIFVMLLVSGTMYFLYNYIYIEFIDKQYVYKVRAAMVAFNEKRGSSGEQITKSLHDFDKQVEESKHFNFKNNVFAYLMNLCVDSLFGLIIALIIKRKRSATY